MDDSLQVIIYIVFLAIYFLSRFLKGGKKGRQRPAREQDREYKEQQEQETDEPMTFEDILRELTQPKERKAARERQAQQSPPKREYEFREDLPDDDEIQEVYEQSKREAKEIKTIDEVVELGEETIEFKEYETMDEENDFASEIRDMLQDADDARKAIVLKEILDRKF